MGIDYIYPPFEVVRDPARCISCRLCEKQCANGVHRFDKEKKSQMLRGSRKSHMAKLRLNEATRIASSLISTPKILFFKRRFN